MINKPTIFGSMVTLGVLLGTTSDVAVAQMPHAEMVPAEQTGGFQRIEQPLWVKAVVTVGGLGLIGLELWWFVLSKPTSRKTTP